MTLPSMLREYGRETTLGWCREIDAGPFASLACGERIAFHNQSRAHRGRARMKHGMHATPEAPS